LSKTKGIGLGLIICSIFLGLNIILDKKPINENISQNKRNNKLNHEVLEIFKKHQLNLKIGTKWSDIKNIIVNTNVESTYRQHLKQDIENSFEIQNHAKYSLEIDMLEEIDFDTKKSLIIQYGLFLEKNKISEFSASLEIKKKPRTGKF
jgi:hypothetical protein